jgi:antitoxin ParD1/3/4
MNVSLTPELERLVNQKVQSGMYSSASEVVREALRLLNEQEELRRRKLEDLRKELQIGLDQLDRGEGVPLDIAKIKSRLRKRLQEQKRMKAR